MLPGALPWDYENWPRVGICREEVKGSSPAVGVFFSCAGWFCTVLGWVTLGWVRLCCQLPEHKGPFYSCQSQPDVPRLVLRIQIPHSILLSALNELLEQWQTHTNQIWWGTYSHRDRNAHMLLVAGTHTNTAWLRHCNHRDPKGIPEQEWAPITCFSTLGACLIRPFPPGHVV